MITKRYLVPLSLLVLLMEKLSLYNIKDHTGVHRDNSELSASFPHPFYSTLTTILVELSVPQSLSRAALEDALWGRGDSISNLWWPTIFYLFRSWYVECCKTIQESLRKKKFILDQELVPKDKILPMLPNKVLLENSHANPLMYCLWLLFSSSYVVESSWQWP